jgi:hypothetical protein
MYGATRDAETEVYPTMKNPILEAIYHTYTGMQRPAMVRMPAYATTIEANVSQECSLLHEVNFELRWRKVINTRAVRPGTETLRNIEHALMADIYGPLQEPMRQLETAIYDNVHDEKERERMMAMLEKMRRFTRP